MFVNKRSVFIVMAYFLITFVSFPRLWAQGELKKAPLEKQKEESKQKLAPSSFTIINGAKIEIVPAKKTSEQQQAESTQEQVSTKNQAQISLDSNSYDVGEIWEGDEVVHTFTIKNTGTAQLTIKKVGAG